MAWWDRLFKRKRRSSLLGLEYRTVFNLYSEDGKREVEVLEFRHGETYLVERDRIGTGTFKDRRPGTLVGPFASPEHAEKFIITTAWFQGRDP